jgi:hypothetical protein
MLRFQHCLEPLAQLFGLEYCNIFFRKRQTQLLLMNRISFETIRWVLSKITNDLFLYISYCCRNTPLPQTGKIKPSNESAPPFSSSSQLFSLKIHVLCWTESPQVHRREKASGTCGQHNYNLHDQRSSSGARGQSCCTRVTLYWAKRKLRDFDKTLHTRDNINKIDLKGIAHDGVKSIHCAHEAVQRLIIVNIILKKGRGLDHPSYHQFPKND